MTKTINGDLIIKKDTFLTEDLIVNGDIICKDHMKYSLFVEGSLEAINIKIKYVKASKIKANRIESEKIIAEFVNANSVEVWDINSQEIDCDDINTNHLDCKNLSAKQINADFVICDKFIPKDKDSKIMAKVFLENRFTQRKEWTYTKEITV